SFDIATGKGMWILAGWVCTLIGASCSAVPDMAAIQAAYEREASAGSALHDRDLQVLEAKCHDRERNENFLCEVTFVSKSDATERLYFDIVSVAPDGSGWRLKSGLCKR